MRIRPARRCRWRTCSTCSRASCPALRTGAYGSSTSRSRPSSTASPGTASKDQNQASQTLSLENLLNMQSRFMPGSENRGVWIINKSVQAKLYGITWNGMPAFMPIGYQINLGGSLTQVQRNTLLGMPVIFSQ
ncbi:phage major capsid protein, partial [Xanthomonas sp. MUS 060]|uniref:phage major capsid protein n=1 Tax=Xanthomonas sp. MUS 060 TaxID=1588031 RepID=UPI00126A0999